MSQLEKKKVQCAIYTMLFIILSTAIYAPFWKNGKTLIWMVDGWSQHYKAMLYYRQWIQTIIENIFVKHTFEIPMYSFSIGYGSDILTTLNYYIIGDPLGVLALLTPEKYMVYAYNFLVVFRIYLAGFAFMFFCYQRGNKNCAGILCGAFSYIFCGYVLYAAIRHPFFVNPMIYFPLLLIGVERVLQEKKSGVLIGVTAIAAVSNFYFLYMLAIMTGIYTIFRVITLKRKQAVWEVIKVVGYAFIGVLIAGIVLIPVIISYLGDNRIGVKTVCDALWGMEYYKCLFQNISSYRIQEEYGMLGFSMIGTLICVSWFCNRKKEEKSEKVFVLILLVCMLFPIFASAFNGFSYAANRYVWALNMMLSYGVVCEWKHFLEPDSKKIKLLCGLVAGYGILCIFLQVTITKAMWKNIFLAMLVVLFFILTQKWKKFQKLGDILVFIAVICSIYNNGKWAYDMKGEYDARMFVSYDMLECDYGVNETAIVKKNADGETFARYTSDNVTYNTTLQNGLHSTQYFWSLSNPAVTSFLKEMAVLENTGIHRYSNLDQRWILNNLLAVRYYVDKKSSENHFVPYGYKKVAEDEYYQLFQDENAQQISYLYDGFLLKSEYDKMNPVQKQEAMIQAVVLKDEDVTRVQDLTKATIQFSNEKYSYSIMEADDRIEIKDHEIRVFEPGAEAVIELDGGKNAENYIYIEGLQFQENQNTIRPGSVNIRFVYEDGEEKRNKQLTYTTEQYLYYQDKHDFIVNMGYEENNIKKMLMIFDVPGIYTYEKLEVYGQLIDPIIEQAKKLRVISRNLSINDGNVAFATNSVSENVKLQRGGLMVFSIPYMKGWNAYVDGKKTPVLQANTMCMAIPVSKGEHKIELKYRTYGLSIGMWVSLIGIIIWGIIIVKDMYKRRQKAFHETKIS